VCTSSANENDDIAESISNHAVLGFAGFVPLSGDFFKEDNMDWREYRKGHKNLTLR
jgi:hypothetical protein